MEGNWREWKIGRKTVFSETGPEGCVRFEGIITEVHEDHLICKADGMRLWIDEDTAYLVH